MKKQKGITLVALVITIVILLILAGVVISQLTGNENIMKGAEKAVGDYNSQQRKEDLLINTVEGYLYDYMHNNTPTGGAESITTATEIQNETTTYIDGTGENEVVVPGGFKVRTDLATTVEDGIVIEDGIGNQFVWIPVGDVVKEDGSTVNIELGRYTFNSENGNPVLEQSADDFEDIVTISDYFQELPTFREAGIITVEEEERDVNATAYDLESFITKTKANKGYYIARYEASYGSGNSADNYIPLFKPSTSYSDSRYGNMDYTEGNLWIEQHQGTASKTCRNIYNNNEFVASDLVNSYAYDTAIVYIQKCSDLTNYSQLEYSDWNNTGTGTDLVCNIYDLSGNLGEFTTEYTTYIQLGVWSGQWFYPVTHRGNSRGALCAGEREAIPLNAWTEYYGSFNGFRAVLYVK